MKAYGAMTGETIAPENAEAATEELVTTSELGETLQDQSKAEELIGVVKDVIVSEDITEPEKIEAVIDETAQKLEIELAEEDKENLLSDGKNRKSGSGCRRLKEQAQDLYEKLEGLDLNISQEQVDGFFATIGSWFQEIWETIKGWFN